ncbi:WbqC family protein [Candidatus Uhrbacteria bacterium]|nr:WbqC family protein [Candidatus Uhrbacteria bacterium]
MRLGIMQPYFFPYIGYFQLMNLVDEFVIYDNIKYTKESWINRNRILVNGEASYISIPLKKDSDHRDIYQRRLADNWPTERRKLINRIFACYKKAPQFDTVYPIIEQSLSSTAMNVFDFILRTLETTKNYLGIETPLLISSTIPINHQLNGEDKILEICRARKATVYINPSGGVALYDKEHFFKNGVDLIFLKTNDFNYPQFDNIFLPSLSIIDVMMFNAKDAIHTFLDSYYTFP